MSTTTKLVKSTTSAVNDNKEAHKDDVTIIRKLNCNSQQSQCKSTGCDFNLTKRTFEFDNRLESPVSHIETSPNMAPMSVENIALQLQYLSQLSAYPALYSVLPLQLQKLAHSLLTSRPSLPEESDTSKPPESNTIPDSTNSQANTSEEFSVTNPLLQFYSSLFNPDLRNYSSDSLRVTELQSRTVNDELRDVTSPTETTTFLDLSTYATKANEEFQNISKYVESLHRTAHSLPSTAQCEPIDLSVRRESEESIDVIRISSPAIDTCQKDLDDVITNSKSRNKRFYNAAEEVTFLQVNEHYDLNKNIFKHLDTGVSSVKLKNDNERVLPCVNRGADHLIHNNSEKSTMLGENVGQIPAKRLKTGVFQIDSDNSCYVQKEFEQKTIKLLKHDPCNENTSPTKLVSSAFGSHSNMYSIGKLHHEINQPENCSVKSNEERNTCADETKLETIHTSTESEAFTTNREDTQESNLPHNKESIQGQLPPDGSSTTPPGEQASVLACSMTVASVYQATGDTATPLSFLTTSLGNKDITA